MNGDNPYGPTIAVQPDPVTAGIRGFSIKRIDVFSAGKMMGIMYALLGLIFSAFMVIAGVIGAAGGAGAAEVGGMLGMGIFMPIAYGIGGFLGGIIGAAIYNLVAGIAGGIRIDLEP